MTTTRADRPFCEIELGRLDKDLLVHLIVSGAQTINGIVRNTQAQKGKLGECHRCNQLLTAFTEQYTCQHCETTFNVIEDPPVRPGDSMCCDCYEELVAD